MKNRIDNRKCARTNNFVSTKTLILAGFAVMMALGISSLALYTRTAATQEADKNMPTLRSAPAVEYLKRKSSYGSLADAFKSIVADDLRENPDAMTKLTSNDGIAGGRFGSSVAISGDTAIIGAPNLPEGNGGSIPGAAYIFVRNGASWAFQQKLTAPDAPAGNGNAFGDSVGISGDTVVVAAPWHDDPEPNSGAAYVFVRTGTTWALQKRFTNADTPLVKFGKLGYSVAISGDTVLVTGFGFVQSSPHRDFVHIFVREGTTWTIQATLITGGDDSFSTRVAISGDTAVIGDPNRAGTRQNAGYIYARCGTEWTQQRRLTSSGSAFDDFGGSVAISGNAVIIGAPADQIAQNQTGSAYIFVTNDGTTWTQQAKLTGALHRLDFGRSVAILGDTAIVGASNGTFAGGTQAGAAEVFVRSGTTWTRDTTITASDGQPGDGFGSGVAISSDSLLAGAPFDDIGATQTNEGSAWATDRITAEPPPSSSPCDDDIEVNITTDQVDADLDDDKCDVDLVMAENQCSLRAAIQTANAKEGPDEIVFNIPGGGVQTISPISELPAITERVTVDATTQPGYVNKPVIELNGINTAITSNGIVFAADSNTSSLKGFTINRFGDAGIVINADEVSITKSFIGIFSDGIAEDPAGRQRRGILITGADNTIGGLRDAVEPSTGSNNLIVGNSVEQIKVIGSSATGNKILGNSIGFSLADDPRVRLEEADGIILDTGSSGNHVGGNGDEMLRNVIQGQIAVMIRESDGNFVTNNGIGNSAAGVAIFSGANNTIGGRVLSENSFTDRNLLANNIFGIFLTDLPEVPPELFSNSPEVDDEDCKAATEEHNRRISGRRRSHKGAVRTTGNRILGNLIGIRNNADAIDDYSNCVGIAISEASGNFIGADETGFLNFISGNKEGGIIIDHLGAENVIRRNYIGTKRNGTEPHPNKHGVNIQGNGNRVENNNIAGNADTGVIITQGTDEDPIPTGNVVHNNRIGLSLGLMIPNVNGIQVDGTSNTLSANNIGGNTIAGIQILNDSNFITDNLIGTDGTGTEPRPNTEFGIFVTSSNNVITGNLISGNGSGIAIARSPETPDFPADNNRLERNYIGTNSAGTAALPGQLVGIGVVNGASSNIIGGTGPNVKNVISGNTGPGILVQPGTSAGATVPRFNKIQGNYIGSDAAGTAAIPNGGDGVLIDGASQTLVGGFGTDMPGARNLISGNFRDGIRLSRGALLNRISGNYIGTKADGTSALGNTERGIRVGDSVSGTIIGGPEQNAGNTIGFNGSNGISLTNDAGNNNIIDPNRIFGNVLAGIDIGENGFTPNDPTDADVGPNKLQNYPTMTLSIVGGDLIVSYQVDSAPANSSYGSSGIYVEFFEADATGAGQDFLGSDHYLLSDYTNGAPGTRQKNLGNAAALGIVAGDRLTATATDADGNSSEFIPAVSAPAGVGFEGDVAPRPNGDGVALSTDITQLRRFVTGLDTPGTTTNEAQRADCAPRTTFGDGAITSGDVVQARRYVTGLDLLTPAGGPTATSIIPESVAAMVGDVFPYSYERELRVGKIKELSGGKQVSVPIEIISNGDEVAISFTLEYDPSKLSDPRITLGEAASSNSTLTVNANNEGRIGILMDSTEAIRAAAVSKRLLIVMFDVIAKGEIRTALRITGSLAANGVSDASGNLLTVRHTNGSLEINR